MVRSTGVDQGDGTDSRHDGRMRTRLRGDDRAVAMQVGATILFAFLIMTLVIYQVQVVPSQNETVEFNHLETVENDMLEVRNTLLSSRQNAQVGYSVVKMGTTYPSRAIASNPPSPSGEMRTTELRQMRVWENGGSGDPKAERTDGVCPGTAETRRLEYTPNYNVLDDAPTMVVENTLLYKNYSSAEVVASSQKLVDANTSVINLIPIRGNYSTSTSRSVSFEPVPGGLKSTDVRNPELTVPTTLSEPKWEELLAEEGVPAANVTVANGNLTVSLGGSYAVTCGPMGINSAPPSGAYTEGDDLTINPAAPGDIALVS